MTEFDNNLEVIVSTAILNFFRDTIPHIPAFFEYFQIICYMQRNKKSRDQDPWVLALDRIVLCCRKKISFFTNIVILQSICSYWNNWGCRYKWQYLTVWNSLADLSIPPIDLEENLSLDRSFLIQKTLREDCFIALMIDLFSSERAISGRCHNWIVWALEKVYLVTSGWSPYHLTPIFSRFTYDLSHMTSVFYP